MVAMTGLTVFGGGFRRLDALWCAESQLSPYLLKEGFNCRDLPHTWCPSRIHPR
jgi:hypothetical protein